MEVDGVWPVFLLAGFLSIDCGSDRNYTDKSTGIVWASDAGYISAGRSVPVQINDSAGVAVLNQGQVGTARIFESPLEKNGYVLPVQMGETYLLRLTFYTGNVTLYFASLSTSFYVSLDNTTLSAVPWTPGK